MKIHSLHLKNFRQFYGNARFEFSVDPESSVTVIHGENGVGKTTILNAIYWSLYGELLEEFEQHSNLVNDYALANENIESCSADLVFEHDGIVRRVCRSFNQVSKSTHVDGFEIQNGNQVPITGFDAVFRRLIPIDMAPYFFFHGEGVVHLGQASGASGFKKAIRTILGFNHADTAINLFENLKSKYLKEEARLNSQDKKASKAIHELSEQEDLVRSLKKKIESDQNNLALVMDKLEEINIELAKIKVKDAAALNKKRVELEIREQRIPGELNSINDQKISNISKYGWAIYGYSFLSEAAEVLDRFRSERKIPAEYNDQFINSLLNSGVCICGAELTEESQARKLVKDLLIGATTSEQEEAVTKATGIAENISDVSDEYIDVLNKQHRRESDLFIEQGDVARRLEEIKADIASINEPEINRLEADREDAKRIAGELRDNISLNKLNLEQAKKRADDARKRKAKVVDPNKLGSIQNKLDLVQDSIDQLTKVVETEEKTAREEIEKLINDRLSKFSRKNYYCDVSTAFNIQLNKTDGNPVAKSRGERSLLNLAFIASLIELARVRSEQSNDFFVQGTVAPFVIDAPFGELDTKYRGAVAQFLPESTEQLITLLSSSHWDESVELNMRNRIGKEYILISESDANEEEGKTEDELVIKGQTWKCALYGSTIPKTTATEI